LAKVAFRLLVAFTVDLKATQFRLAGLESCALLTSASHLPSTRADDVVRSAARNRAITNVRETGLHTLASPAERFCPLDQIDVGNEISLSRGSPMPGYRWLLC
jgi:hypothetical protein